MEILFVRHGRTEWNNKKKMQGNVDIPLSNKGTEHAKVIYICKRRWQYCN